jgi:transposase-like protein
VSLRKIAHHIKQFYDVEIHNTSVLRWIRRFGEVVSPFVDNLSPKVSGIYHVDEMMIHTRREQMEIGNYQWLWNLMDDTTRFWISSKVSQRRELSDVRNVFKDEKRKTKIPKAIIHDGLPSYDGAFQKEFYTAKNPRVRNIRSISVRNQGLNSKVERLNGTMREREKVMRGMQRKETAQQFVDAMRIHYNFVREHQTLQKTPAEKAGIRLGLGGNKIESLIRLASKNNQGHPQMYYRTKVIIVIILISITTEALFMVDFWGWIGIASTFSIPIAAAVIGIGIVIWQELRRQDNRYVATTNELRSLNGFLTSITLSQIQEKISVLHNYSNSLTEVIQGHLDTIISDIRALQHIRHLLTDPQREELGIIRGRFVNRADLQPDIVNRINAAFEIIFSL